ncbi:tRNA preQ1(34) S-adenosylmethionine ribosyltransferase-isomerase QueA [Komagataeibacter sucrofermentans]|uniref:S-adenosylmethionine:tRNA ribosyltransferase-isomerase n=1 Tax=Komagataeibacter sucrofermentans TaxID=1053551 RepID=A0A318QHE0_9PROT|nr:tRNA preQ1(34) S-adenosylmethionine ribosyltransferase-isomerase QueA [Komagataeibacter sucrofermentans]PYD78505.1 tRNA preQ1(34) S-adenosylmethionine ribosyltransferase-isomerase QueA [Komagataeibacter sucrofermentans]GBQ52442.1 S-adenosylmethionine:tRNA ribosyltransferase-isomerase [Komagataeibacter sucrofermentans DSM 15973]
MTDLVSDFDFTLPPTSIADHPARPRDSARLLDVPQAGPFIDRHVRDLPGCLRAGDILVANDTAVIPAQLAAMRGEAKIGITLDRILPDGSWHVLARNARRLRPGDTLTFGRSTVTAEVISRGDAGDVTLRFSAEGAAFDQFLHDAGKLALPPYIARPDGPTEEDRKDYSTIFAQHRGAVAAPTAGLHFTPDLLAALDKAGVIRQTLTLHVGAGTFLPMRSDQISAHRMHAERGTISPHAAQRINAARAAGGRIVAVGTTSLRLLESATDENGIVHPFHGETAIFIKPGYRFRAVDMLLTNFHLPRSTLFMLVCAFGGYHRMQAAYAHAIASGYRFYSYGDACLLHRTEGDVP